MKQRAALASGSALEGAGGVVDNEIGGVGKSAGTVWFVCIPTTSGGDEVLFQ